MVKIDDKVYQPEYKELFKGTKYMGHIITLSDITDGYNYARLMKKMTETDPLTGLSNRFAYEYQISELKKNEHLPDNLILFSIDINGLKNVNDSLGHGIGDSLIYAASQCISNVMTQYGKCFCMVIMVHIIGMKSRTPKMRYLVLSEKRLEKNKLISQKCTGFCKE